MSVMSQLHPTPESGTPRPRWQRASGRQLAATGATGLPYGEALTLAESLLDPELPDAYRDVCLAALESALPGAGLVELLTYPDQTLGTEYNGPLTASGLLREGMRAANQRLPGAPTT
ncbi:MAG: hypothetical protein AAF721_07195 [Myxococcota bacterium]